MSGTTATVAAISGWEAVIANVGDSCAYMDTGVEVVLVSLLCRCSTPSSLWASLYQVSLLRGCSSDPDLAPSCVAGSDVQLLKAAESLLPHAVLHHACTLRWRAFPAILVHYKAD